VEWYKQHAYQNLAWFTIKGLGHDRTPELVASFFGRVAGARAKQPSPVLAARQVIAGEAQTSTLFTAQLSPGL
jgi:hypothetical protein